MRQTTLPGDHEILDATMRFIHQNGLHADKLLLRMLPEDDAVVEASTLDLLGSRHKSIGFLCRSLPIATVVDRVCRASHVASRIAVSDVYPTVLSRSHPWDHLVCSDSAEEIGRRLATVLNAQLHLGIGGVARPEPRLKVKLVSSHASN
jgi:hypothetical protein